MTGFSGFLEGELGSPSLRRDEEQKHETQGLESFKRVHINMAPDPRTIPHPISAGLPLQEFSDTSNPKSGFKISFLSPSENSTVRFAALDTSSSLNVIKEETFLLLGVKLEAYDGPPLVGFGGHRLKLLGTCRVDWHVSGNIWTYRDKFLVTESQYMEPDVIFGRDIFKKVGFHRRNEAEWYDLLRGK